MCARVNRWILPSVAIAGLIGLAVGCGGVGTDDSSTSTILQPAGATVGATTSSPVDDATSSTTPPPTEAFDQAGYGATTVVTGLRIPWEMRFMPDGRLLVTEREGRVVIADVGTGQVTEVGRIEVSAKGEGGLMGLALDPDFPTNPRIYVSYTASDGGRTRNRVSSFELTGLDNSPALGAETVLLDGIPAANIHNGSRVAFGPDGYLWVTTGDAGDAGLAQEMDSLAGKVLRMAEDGRPAPDNPFADEPYPFSLIYTWGHRNPQGLDFHPESGTAFVTEHGTDENDEVNVLQPGGNYGWPEFRGSVGKEGYVDPIDTWTPTVAPAAGLFYFGQEAVGPEGAFVFVTLKERDIRVLTPQDRAFSAVKGETVLFDGEFGRLRAIAVGPDSALYVATSNHDGRGSPGPKDDRIIRIQVVE